MDTANVPSDFLDLLPVGVFQTDIKLVLRYANKPAYEIFGYAPDDIGPTFNVMRLFVPTELPKLTMYTGKLLAGHPGPPVAYKMKRKNGEVVWAEIYSAVVWDNRKIVGFRGIIRDLSEQQEMQKKSKEEQQERFAIEERLSFLLNNAPLALFAGDLSGEITFSEGQYAELLGLHAGTSAAAKDPTAPSFLSNIRAALSGEETLSRIEVAGELFSVRLSPLHDDNGQVAGFIGIAIDVTIERECEELHAFKDSYLGLRQQVAQVLAKAKQSPIHAADLEKLLK